MSDKNSVSKNVEEVIRSQREFFSEGNTIDVEYRLSALVQLEEELVRSEKELIEALHKDLGKPMIEAFLAEFYFIKQELKQVKKNLRKWLKPVRKKSPLYFWPCRSEVRLYPLGNSLIFAPWNYPIQLSLSPMIASIAAGNTVLLKPSELAPASGEFLEKLITKCFDPKHVTVVTGGVEVAEDLLKDKFDHIFFTGSTQNGIKVAKKAAESLTPSVLELGGKCPVIVNDASGFEEVAKRIWTGKLFNSGQTCFAPDFVAVKSDQRSNLIESLKKVLMELPWEEEMASIVNENHFNRLQNLVSGAEIKKGENQPETLHFAPRLLPEAHWGDEVMKEEIFGPILPILEYSDIEELIQKLKEMSSPLGLMVFSEKEDFIEKMMNQVASGGVCVNDTMKQGTNLELPFGGVGSSGWGRYRGLSGLKAFSNERSIAKRKLTKDRFEMLPPRKKKAETLKKWMK